MQRKMQGKEKEFLFFFCYFLVTKKYNITKKEVKTKK
jgi:hypothetical protein